jgi:hypothetical protein
MFVSRDEKLRFSRHVTQKMIPLGQAREKIGGG